MRNRKASNPQLHRELVGLYYLSPVLWAVVKGYTTRHDVALRLNRGVIRRLTQINHAVDTAIAAGFIDERDGQLSVTSPHLHQLAADLAGKG